MLRNLFLATLLLSISSFGAAGSGIFIKGGIGKGRILSTNDKYKIQIFNPYTSNSLFPGGNLIDGQSPVAPTNLSLGYEFSIIRPISFYGGIGFQIFGLDYDSEGITENWEVHQKDRYNYLTIPLGIKAQIPMRNGGFYASLNPQLGFLLSAKSQYEQKDDSTNISTTTDIKKESGNDLNSVNFLLGFRIGGDISIGKHNLFIESGYDFGLTPLNSNDINFNGDKVDIKTGILTILAIGFRFNTSEKFRN